MRRRRGVAPGDPGSPEATPLELDLDDPIAPATPVSLDDVPRTEQPPGLAMADPLMHARGTRVGFLFDALRRRRGGRRALSGLTAVLFVSGMGMFAFPFFLDQYTNLVLQPALEDDFASITVDSFEEWEATVEPGRALTRILIPAIDVNTLVVEGTSPSALRAGAGHYPNTPLPGQTGNVAIAGHRTTYGRPFNQLDVLEPGDVVWLATPIADYRYVVSSPPEGWADNPLVTLPTDWHVVGPTAEASLTLSTCHPKGSAAQRLVVRATLTESLPPGSAEAETTSAAPAA